MRGVCLHVLGDLLGSIGVMISGFCVLYIPYDWKYYLDPAVSVVLAAIILKSSVPLVRRTSHILLQGVPESIELAELRDDIVRVPDVDSVHELHVWHVSETTLFATVHVRCSRVADFTALAERIRSIFHDYGIHSCAIQPEFVADAAQPVRRRAPRVRTRAA